MRLADGSMKKVCLVLTVICICTGKAKEVGEKKYMIQLFTLFKI